MARATTKLTRTRIEKLEPGRIHWDSEVRGFGVNVREKLSNSAFIFQRDLLGRTIKVTIGRVSVWNVEKARQRARELAVEIDKGNDPRRPEGSQMTVRDALDLHIRSMEKRECSPRSIDTIRRNVELHLSKWLDRPLTSITRAECVALHDRITRTSGAYAANHIVVHLGTLWNAAKKLHDDLPDTPPTIAVTKNKQRRRREPVTWDDLPGWWSKVEGIKNPVRRDLQLFILFTGLRRDDAKKVKWKEVDLDAGTIHRPKPKGGEDRAFTVPISAFIIELLRRRAAENVEDNGWVFPTTVRRRGQLVVTHVREVKEQRYDEDGRKVPYLPSPHRLRDTFATAGHEARIHPMDLKILMNHALPNGDVTEGYIRPSEDHLRESAEKIAAVLLEKACQDVYSPASASARSSVG